MSYDGTPTPANYAGPDQPTSNTQIAAMQAIVKSLLGQQPQFMQHWTQPLAHMANTAVAMQLFKQMQEAQRANAAAVVPPPGPYSAVPSPQPAMQPQPPVPPNPAVPTGPTGNPSAISSQPPAPRALSGFDPFFGLFGGT